MTFIIFFLACIGVIALVLLVLARKLVWSIVVLFFAYWIDKAHGRNTFN